MNFEGFLNFFTHHVESIIQWLFLAILALTGFLISRGLLSKKQDSGAPASVTAGPSPELEAMLKQILERTSKLETATAAPGMTPEAAALADTQLQALKKELAARDEELKALKASGGGGKVTEEAAKLNSRLKELETKLAEYEILEDDIADLSLYKEENLRLRSELEKVRGGGAPAPTGEVPAAPAPAATEAPAPREAPKSAAEDNPVSASAAAAANPNIADDIVAEFAQAVNAEASADAADITMQVPDTGDPMNDFEAAVKIEKKAKAPESAPAPAAAAPAAAKPAATASAPPAKAADAKGESDDLFAEFGEAPADEGALDTDKMMAEMAALVSLEPSSDSSLEEGIDTDKMAAEAGNFQKR